MNNKLTNIFLPIIIFIIIIIIILILSIYLYFNNIENFILNKKKFTIIPIKPIGCEIIGIDLIKNNCKLDIELVKELEIIMAKYGFILFRNQGSQQFESGISGKYLTGEQQINLSKNFGSNELYSTHSIHKEAPNRDIFRLSNNPKHGFNSVGPEWHNDGSFEKEVFGHVIYHIIKAPNGEGNTQFAHLGLAYKLLNKELQERLENCASINSHSGVIHPLIHNHPISNIKSLYLHLGMTGAIIEKKNKYTEKNLPKYIKDNDNRLKNIVCWKNNSMNSLFTYLNNLFNRNDISYSHKWKEGDIIIIDNLAIAHKATKGAHIIDNGLRILHRTTVHSNRILDPIKELQLEDKLNIKENCPFENGAIWNNSYVGYRWGNWKERSIPH